MPGIWLKTFVPVGFLVGKSVLYTALFAFSRLLKHSPGVFIQLDLGLLPAKRTAKLDKIRSNPKLSQSFFLILCKLAHSRSLPTPKTTGH
jgi:hypothetical protein